jgi:hypothetical protein
MALARELCVSSPRRREKGAGPNTVCSCSVLRRTLDGRRVLVTTMIQWSRPTRREFSFKTSSRRRGVRNADLNPKKRSCTAEMQSSQRRNTRNPMKADITLQVKQQTVGKPAEGAFSASLQPLRCYPVCGILAETSASVSRDWAAAMALLEKTEPRMGSAPRKAR